MDTKSTQMDMFDTLCCFKDYNDIQTSTTTYVVRATGLLGHIKFLVEDLLYSDENPESCEILYISCPPIVLDAIFTDDDDPRYQYLEDEDQDKMIGNLAFIYTGDGDELVGMFEEHDLEYTVGSTWQGEDLENECNNITITNPFTKTLWPTVRYEDIQTPNKFSQATGLFSNIKRFLESEVVLTNDVDILYTSCIHFVMDSLFSRSDTERDIVFDKMTGNLKFNYIGSDDELTELFKEYDLEFQGEFKNSEVATCCPQINPSSTISGTATVGVCSS